MNRTYYGWGAATVLLLTCLAAPANAVDLLQRYPTTLTKGDVAPDRARAWEFTTADLFRLSRFKLEVADLKVETGLADLGIGHCQDGAVWAVVLPREGGKLTSSAASDPETIGHVWLRFHPKEINRLFPPETVAQGGASKALAPMRAIANAKMFSSWQAGGWAIIPEPKDLTVDADTQDGPRRFFIVDTEVPKADYVAAFAGRSVRLSSEDNSDAAEDAPPQPAPRRGGVGQGPLVGRKAPDFHIQGIYTEPYSLETFKGHIMVMQFGASW